ncbi:phage terminase small subunit P27 family [Staphylococcus shinii]|uniref:phage terminase small subunit P27 family n=1 Tax=Staphylococcus shinii TaxID=2912228 RepID=UPI003F848591
MAKPNKLLSQSSKNYTKEEIEKKEKAEEALKTLTPLDLEPPEWLSKTAKEEYRRIYPLLKQLPVASLDLSLVSTYCQAYADYQEANILLQEEDLVVTTAHGSKLNPLHTIKRDSFNIINSIAPKLGMSIDSRLKILEPKGTEKKDKDVMDDFL